MRKDRYNSKRVKKDRMAIVPKKIQWQFEELQIRRKVKVNRWEKNKT